MENCKGTLDPMVICLIDKHQNEAYEASALLEYYRDKDAALFELYRIINNDKHVLVDKMTSYLDENGLR